MDATVGFININQNKIIKIFSVASVALLPPTLIASIYGMNFRFMPELDWAAGYPFALGLMVAGALVPMWYFSAGAAGCAGGSPFGAAADRSGSLTAAVRRRVGWVRAANPGSGA